MVTAVAPVVFERRAVRLAWATIAWNVVEAVVAIAAGRLRVRSRWSGSVSTRRSR